MNDGDGNRGSPFFGALPSRGVWTAVGLSRGEFLVILAVSVIVFLFLDGPLWEDREANHFRRIAFSYASIPAMILAAQLGHRRFDLAALFGGSIVIGVIKLLVTALIVLFLFF